MLGPLLLDDIPDGIAPALTTLSMLVLVASSKIFLRDSIMRNDRLLSG